MDAHLRALRYFRAGRGAAHGERRGVRPCRGLVGQHRTRPIRGLLQTAWT